MLFLYFSYWPFFLYFIVYNACLLIIFAITFSMCQMSLIGRLIKENRILIITQNNFNQGWFSLTFQVFWWWSNTLPIWPSDPRSAPGVSTATYRWALTCTTPGLCRSSCRRSASLCQLLAHLDGSWWTPARLSSLPFSHQRWSRSATFYSQTLNSPSEDWECRSWRRGGDWRRRRRRRRAARASSPGAAPPRCSVSPPAARRRRGRISGAAFWLHRPGRVDSSAAHHLTCAWRCPRGRVRSSTGRTGTGRAGRWRFWWAGARRGEVDWGGARMPSLHGYEQCMVFEWVLSCIPRGCCQSGRTAPRAPEPKNAWKLQFNTSITSSTASHSTRVLGSLREHESRAAAHRRPPAPKVPDVSMVVAHEERALSGGSSALSARDLLRDREILRHGDVRASLQLRGGKVSSSLPLSLSLSLSLPLSLPPLSLSQTSDFTLRKQARCVHKPCFHPHLGEFNIWICPHKKKKRSLGHTYLGEMKMHSLSTHPCADGGGGWSVRVHKTLLEFQG